LPDADFVTDRVEEVVLPADRTGIQSKRGGGEAHDADLRVQNPCLGQKLPIHPFAIGRNEVALVHEDQIKRIEFARPFVNGLDAGHDHGMLRVPPLQTSGVDSHGKIAAHLLQLVDRLLQQFFDVGQDQDAAVPGLDGIAADRGHDRSLAAAGRDHDDGIVIAFPQVLVHRINGLLLIGTEREHVNGPHTP
jgi:hypothetical protein